MMRKGVILSVIILLAATATAVVTLPVNVYPKEGIIDDQRLTEAQLSIGTGQGQMLYWQTATNSWIPTETPPASDEIPFWDFSATAIKFLTIGAGLTITDTTITSSLFTHAILSAGHTDAVADAVTRGSIIYGNATPKWDELVIGGATTFIKSDGTDIAWEAIDLGTDTTGNYVASITDGLAIDGGDGGSEGAALTLAFDPTELLGNRTWGDASTDAITWTWDRATGTDPTFTFGDNLISTANVFVVEGLGTGGRTSYDLKVGDTTTPDYGMIQFGNAVLGRTSYKVGNIDLDGAILFQNIGGPVTSDVEFCFAISTGSSTRFALAKAGVGLASYHSRSFLIAGPAPANTDYVKVSYWQTTNSIFDNLACDTAGTGADLGVQNDLEVEGDIFVDSIKESTTGADITLGNDTVINGNLTGTDLDISAGTGDYTATGDITLSGLDSILDLDSVSATTQFDNFVKFGPLTGWSTWLGGAHGDVQEGIILRTAGNHIYSFFGTGTTDTKLAIGVENENYPRMFITAGGQINFGDGTANQNVNIYWGAANLLKTDDAFTAAGAITGASVTVDGATWDNDIINAGSDSFTIQGGSDISLISDNDGDVILDASASGVIRLLDDTILTGTLDAGATTVTGFQAAITTKTNTNYTLTINDYTVLFSTSSTNRTASLPAASTMTGKTYHIKKIDNGSGTVIVDGNGSETIDDATTAVITAQYESITCQSDGTEWWIL